MGRNQTDVEYAKLRFLLWGGGGGGGLVGFVCM